MSSLPPEQLAHFDTYGYVVVERLLDPARDLVPILCDYEEILDEKNLLEILPVILQKLDEPLADPSLLPTYLLSQLASRHVKVALGGDGGD